MKELNKRTINLSFIRSDAFHTYEDAAKNQDAFINVAKLGNKTRVSNIVKDKDLNYYVDALTINDDEHKRIHDKVSKEEAVLILAGISKTISQS